jgi:hypothetical protein
MDERARASAREMAEQIIAATSDHVGRSHDELSLALAAIHVDARWCRIKDGLAKLVLDRCEFATTSPFDPVELRRDVFGRASAMRAALDAGSRLERAAVLDAVAGDRGTSRDAVVAGLFADLRGAEVLTAFDRITAEALLAAYERGQAQAVLLRAVKVTVVVKCASPGATRALFRRLKFLRLLHDITRVDDGYQIVIDGPFSLFESVTRYGQKLALMLPALDACDEWQLEADVRWGKERQPLVFRLRGGTPGARSKAPPLPDEVRTLMTRIAAMETRWAVSPNVDILELRGVGLTVPDLVFEAREGTGAPRRVYLEVMGYWSRDAVWKRVELVRAGLAEKIVFAVSSRLRVSEAVLDADLPSALYVYKGTMSARVILDRVEAL